jgi:hypothetical protein
MILTHFEITTGALSVILAALVSLGAGVRWIYNQGASSQSLVNAVNENTTATGKLTAAYEKFTEKTDGTLLDHEKRITRLEGRP